MRNPPAPAPRCQSCQLTPADWHEPDEGGTRWAVRLRLMPDGTYRCTRCIENEA